MSLLRSTISDARPSPAKQDSAGLVSKTASYNAVHESLGVTRNDPGLVSVPASTAEPVISPSAVVSDTNHEPIHTTEISQKADNDSASINNSDHRPVESVSSLKDTESDIEVSLSSQEPSKVTETTAVDLISDAERQVPVEDLSIIARPVENVDSESGTSETELQNNVFVEADPVRNESTENPQPQHSPEKFTSETELIEQDTVPDQIKYDTQTNINQDVEVQQSEDRQNEFSPANKHSEHSYAGQEKKRYLAASEFKSDTAEHVDVEPAVERKETAESVKNNQTEVNAPSVMVREPVNTSSDLVNKTDEKNKKNTHAEFETKKDNNDQQTEPLNTYTPDATSRPGVRGIKSTENATTSSQTTGNLAQRNGKDRSLTTTENKQGTIYQNNEKHDNRLLQNSTATDITHNKKGNEYLPQKQPKPVALENNNVQIIKKSDNPVNSTNKPQRLNQSGSSANTPAEIRIGQVDVFIEAPARADSVQRNKPSSQSSSLSSRLYLRRL